MTNKSEAEQLLKEIIEKPEVPISKEDKKILKAGFAYPGSDNNQALPLLLLKIAMYEKQNTEKMIESNEKLAESNSRTQKSLTRATWALVFATSVMALFVLLPVFCE